MQSDGGMTEKSVIVEIETSAEADGLLSLLALCRGEESSWLPVGRPQDRV
jgi:hypothetical protein